MNVGEIGPFRPPCARYLVYASIERQRARKDHPLKNLIPKACLFPSTWLRILTVPSCCFPRGGINIREAFVLLRRNSLFSLEGLFRGGGNLGACFSVFRCFLKLGEWQLNLQGINESTIDHLRTPSQFFFLFLIRFKSSQCSSHRRKTKGTLITSQV